MSSPPPTRSCLGGCDTLTTAYCGASESSPLAPTAENIAVELKLLIEAARITNPIVLVGHSWVGIILRELVVLCEGGKGDGSEKKEKEGGKRFEEGGKGVKIAGLVLVDANQEKSLEVLNVLHEDLEEVLKTPDFYGDMGITAQHVLTPSEWTAFLADEAEPKFELQAAREEGEYEKSFKILQKKKLGEREEKLLGDRPLYVIGGSRERDWRSLFKAGTERGNGTEEQRGRVKEMIGGADELYRGLIEGHMGLSTRTKLVWAGESGHFVQLTEPGVVVEGCVWVLGELRRG